MWIRGWPMDFRHKGLVMQTAFPYHDVIVQWSNIQSSAVLTRPNMIRYFINICRNSDRISEAGPIIDIPYLARRANYGLSFVKMCEKIDRVITVPHYITNKVEYEGLCCIWQPGVETQQEKRSTVKSSEASHSCYCTIRLHDFLAVRHWKRNVIVIQCAPDISRPYIFLDTSRPYIFPRITHDRKETP